MTTLRVIVDDVLAPTPNGQSRYAEELTRALIATAPRGASVEGVVSASPEAEYEDLLDRLRGMSLYKSSLARRELAAAWQHGFTRLPGLVHAPSLLAPLFKHDRLHTSGYQAIVTLHDVSPWLHPESVVGRSAGWHVAMAQRAHRYADALVVPSHAVANQLAEHLDFGDRVRVIGGAPSTTLAVPANADIRAERLGLPQNYVVAVGDASPRRGLDRLIAALARPETLDLDLVLVGTGSVAARDAALAAGIPERRVHALRAIADADYATVLDRATALVLPSRLEGFGLTMLEAFQLGTPVVHSDDPALLELGGDAGVVIEDGDDFVESLATALVRVAEDREHATSLATAGLDRAGLFTWESSAEKVWQLHAEL